MKLNNKIVKLSEIIITEKKFTSMENWTTFELMTNKFFESQQQIKCTSYGIPMIKTFATQNAFKYLFVESQKQRTKCLLM